MKYVVNADEIKSRELTKGVTIKVMAMGHKMTGLSTFWEPGTKIAEHTHPHEQMGVCLQGEGIFTIDGKDYVVKKHEVYNISSNIPHALRNDGDETAIFMECFCPIREDWHKSNNFDDKYFVKSDK